MSNQAIKSKRRTRAQTRPRRPHPTVPLQWEAQAADIDVKIAPLVLEMWKAGIKTLGSCQGHPKGWVWLQFDSLVDLGSFLDIVARFAKGDPSLAKRMVFGYHRPDGPHKKQWWYRMVADDISVDEIETPAGDLVEERLGPPDFWVLVAVHFPRSDLDRVSQALVDFNQARQSDIDPEHREVFDNSRAI